jgi:hypothetical protein
MPTVARRGKAKRPIAASTATTGPVFAHGSCDPAGYVCREAVLQKGTKFRLRVNFM